jgi:hypothetical protein
MVEEPARASVTDPGFLSAACTRGGILSWNASQSRAISETRNTSPGEPKDRANCVPYWESTCGGDTVNARLDFGPDRDNKHASAFDILRGLP